MRSLGRLELPQPQICDESAATVSRREAHGGADLAHRPLAAIVDDGGAYPGAVAAVALVDVLDHLLSALVLEVDVDVGRFVAGLRDEALEDHGADLRRDRGDPEREADHGVRRRAAALAEDLLGAGEVDHVADGEKVGGVVQPPDQGEFVARLGLDLFRHADRVTPFQAFRGQPFESRLWILALPDLARIFVAQILEAEVAVSGDFTRAVHRRLVAGEEPQHVGLGAQAALGVGQRRPADRIDADAFADASQHVHQPAAGAVVHERLGGGDERQAEVAGEPHEAGQAGGVLPIVARRGDEMGMRVAIGECAGLRQPSAEPTAERRMDEQVQVGEVDEVLGVEEAGAFGRAAGAFGEEAAQAGPSGAVPRQSGELRTFDETEPGGRKKAGHGSAAASGFLQFLVGADKARDRVAVGDGQGGQTELDGTDRVFLRMAASSQEGEIRGDGKLGECHGRGPSDGLRVQRGAGRPGPSLGCAGGAPPRGAEGLPLVGAWRSAAFAASLRRKRASPAVILVLPIC